MGLLCARLSCRHEAAASLQFNADDAQVIIIDLTEPTGGIPLCQEHVRTRTAPIGWTMVDHRLAMPPRRHLESVPQPELSMSISAPPRPDADITSAHPSAGLASDHVTSDVVAPSVVGPTERPMLRRPTDRGFPWEWAKEDDASTDEPIDGVESGPLADDDATTADTEEGIGTEGAARKPSTPLLSRAFRNNPIDPDEAS